MLRHVPRVTDPRVLVDAALRDDAAVFRLSDDRALVATLDFFTPIVDDPYDFGAIAAANALSDLYAMGATPLCALNIVAWPRKPELLALVADVLRGGADVAARAGALILGGHSIDDDEPKYGLVALGEARPDNIITNRGARPGDLLVLTKKIGTGILSTALKRDRIGEAEMRDAVRSMTTLNAAAAAAMRATGDGVHAATDVTGFGLLGHLHALLEASGCGARLAADAVPEFVGVRDLAADRVVPGGTDRNLADAVRWTSWDAIDTAQRTVLADAQTSGGLLIAVAADRLDHLASALTGSDTLAAVIGRVTEGEPGTIEVVPGTAP